MLLVLLIHAWWLALSCRYLVDFWRSPAVAGSDASGHVAALQLYSAHVYPDIYGYIPEFFGGMPFPVFYPPLFYWAGATLMKLCGISATLAAKLMTTLSFLALPGALFGLGRRLGLSGPEAAAASALAAIIACGLNFASLFAVGIAGLFEVGLYTHTAGFVWLCIWCGALPHARRTRGAALVAVASLAAMILTNVHVLPVGATYGVCWVALDGWRFWRLNVERRAAGLFINLRRPVAAALLGVMVAAIWWVPLVALSRYTVGQSQHFDSLFAGLGFLNLLWLPPALVGAFESRRRPALCALCVSILIAALASLCSPDSFVGIPLQSWRLISTALLLSTLPTAMLCLRLSRELLRSPAHAGVGAAVVLTVLVLLHPPVSLDAAALTRAEAEALGKIRVEMKGLPPGAAVVEIFELEETSGLSPTSAFLRERVVSRALINQLAMDGRPVIWTIFREHAVSAPLAAAVRNLFSSTPEKFGLDGVAVRRASGDSLGVAAALKLARLSGCAYFLVKSQAQVRRLRGSPDVRPLLEAGGWHLFVANIQPPPFFETWPTVPVLAWLPAKFRNRSPDDFDLFNLGEFIAFEGRPEVTVLWAPGGPSNVAAAVSGFRQAIAIIDPSAAGENLGHWLDGLSGSDTRWSVILLDDGSPLARRIHERRSEFADYVRIDRSGADASRELLGGVARVIIKWQDASGAGASSDVRQLWRTSAAYFPSWETATGDAIWLTGQGGMAVLATQPPSIMWQRSSWQYVGALFSVLGILLTPLGLSKSGRVSGTI